jgi:hypothetical protein
MTPQERRRARLFELYGFHFPAELERVYAFCRSLKPLDPLRALEESLGFTLVGPFEVLDGRFDRIDPPAPMLLHHRRPWELPEFFPVMVAEDGSQHWGYFLDDPDAGAPSCAALTDRGAGPGASLEGDSLAGGLRLWVEQAAADLEQEGPDPDMTEAQAREVSAMLSRCRGMTQKLAKAIGVNLPAQTGDAYIRASAEALADRDALVTLPTQDGTGIVAPPETCRTTANLTRLHEAVWRKAGVAWLQRMARRALDSGRPGLALFIGRELWAPGTRRRRAIAAPILEEAYTMLGRPTLAKVVAAERAHADRAWRDVGKA